MSPARKRARKPVKVTDEATVIRCASGDGLIREERWEDEDGNTVRYNLAFINFHLFPRGNGRVLGYDTAHGRVHRHFAGKVEAIASAPFQVISARFIAQVDDLRKREKL